MNKGKNLRFLVLTFLLSSVFLHVFSLTTPRSLAITTMSVYPSVITVSGTQTFSISINVSSVTDLYGWEFRLSWAPALLDAISITEGSFLKQGSSSTFFASKTNNTEGYVIVSCTLLGIVPGKNGSGGLATIGFNIKKAGECLFDLCDTKLVSSSELSIPHQAVDGYGYFTNIHDVAVVDVKPAKEKVILGHTLVINVTVENQGSFQETFTVTAYYNSTVILTQIVTNLAVGSQKILSFVWNTTGLALGDCTISARASQVSGEIQTNDNILVDGIVTVLILKGDINEDGVVDIFDIVVVAAAFGSSPPSDPRADLNNDGIIDIFDIVIVASDFGKSA